ncbi:hypothetical protein ACIA6T_04260 [Streptomyces sp. NPDC051740]|uniref:hypothetical protein n=1 Tax=Streptomyces sp. NPDC051740 TaxID=3365673 RepID=UPI00379320CA
MSYDQPGPYGGQQPGPYGQPPQVPRPGYGSPRQAPPPGRPGYGRPRQPPYGQQPQHGMPPQPPAPGGSGTPATDDVASFAAELRSAARVEA